MPSGRTPTTPNLNPPTGEFEDHAENEHLCMRLAVALGSIVARSRVRRFEDQVAIVIERHDRERTPSGIVRVLKCAGVLVEFEVVPLISGCIARGDGPEAFTRRELYQPDNAMHIGWSSSG